MTQATGVAPFEALSGKPFTVRRALPYSDAMKTVEEIEQEIQELSPAGVAKLSAWLAEYDAKVWDAQMEDDDASGRFDFLFDEADKERESGKLRDWPPEQKKA